MNAVEKLCFDRAMDAWQQSRGRADLTEEDRVKGALLAYMRQAEAVDVMARAESAEAYRGPP